MKLLFAVIFINLYPCCLFSQVYSTITYDAGTQIEVQSGADVCANDILINGSFTGGGTLCTGPLPVTLSEFIFSTDKNSVELRWKTELEVNNSGFDIERKSAETHAVWKKIGFVNGHGNTNEPKMYSYGDKNLPTGKYFYRLKQIDFNGNYEYFDLFTEVVIGKPQTFKLWQNYPNPSNPKSKIDFEIPERNNVSIKIYNILGEEVSELINEFKEPGYYTVEFDGSSLASGTYFYRILSGNYTEIKKIILVK
jgi:hypothetical protein